MTLDSTTRYGQPEPIIQCKFNKEHSVFHLRFDHSRPRKLEDFFEKDDHAILEINLSTYSKVQSLIKDIKFYKMNSFRTDYFSNKLQKKMDIPHIYKTKIAEYIGSKCFRLLENNLKLLYNIYSYTSAAYGVPECKNKRLTKTISKLAFATLKEYKKNSTPIVSQLVKSIFNSDDNSSKSNESSRSSSDNSDIIVESSGSSLSDEKDSE